MHLKNRQIVQTPISHSTLKVFWKSHTSNLLDFSLALLLQCDQNHDSNLTSNWREKDEKSVNKIKD